MDFFFFSQNLTTCLGYDLDDGITDGDLKTNGMMLADEKIQHQLKIWFRYIVFE